MFFKGPVLKSFMRQVVSNLNEWISTHTRRTNLLEKEMSGIVTENNQLKQELCRTHDLVQHFSGKVQTLQNKIEEHQCHKQRVHSSPWWPGRRISCNCIRTRGGIYGQIYPSAWRCSRGRSPRELLKAEGYIWPYIPSRVLIRTLYHFNNH